VDLYNAAFVDTGVLRIGDRFLSFCIGEGIDGRGDAASMFADPIALFDTERRPGARVRFSARAFKRSLSSRSELNARIVFDGFPAIDTKFTAGGVPAYGLVLV
jgi:hypothetical protein